MKMTCTTKDNLAAKWESKSQKRQKGFHMRRLCIDPILVSQTSTQNDIYPAVSQFILPLATSIQM